MKFPDRLAGIVPPLLTPLRADFTVDEASLRRLVDEQIHAGVDALFMLGSTGEAALLPDNARSHVLRAAVDEACGRVPVLAGVIDMTTLRVLDHARRARDAGADAIVMTAPFYTRTHRAEIDFHFRYIAAHSDLPIMAYDLPISTGVKLDAALLVQLGKDGVIAGVKDSSGDDAGLRKLVLAVRDARLDKFSVLTGSELTVDSALAFGIDGCVPGLGNVDPAGYVRLYRAAREGRWADARREQERLIRLFRIVDAAPLDRMGRGSSALGAFKAAVMLRGVIDSCVTAPPYLPLDQAEIAFVDQVLREVDLA